MPAERAAPHAPPRPSKKHTILRHTMCTPCPKPLPEYTLAEPGHEITVAMPCDMHLHLRDDVVLNTVASLSAKWAGRAIIMPNLQPPVTTADMAVAYRNRILAALPDDTKFDPNTYTPTATA